jgi:hypothetical protein
MADMSVYLIQRTAFELLTTKPWSTQDVVYMATALLPPM